MSSNESGVKTSKKNRKQQMAGDDAEIPALTKEENQIARFLRLSCPNRQGNLSGMKVDFFIANKLVDCLMESKWGPVKQVESTKQSGKQSLFASRQACVSFMQRLMNKQLFYRAVKIYKEQVDKSSDSSPILRKRKPVKENQTPSSTPSQQQQQQKKKFKLEMHEEQRFFDSNEPYVWVFDPTSTKTYIIGLLLIFGAIGICLFPLWPSQVRDGVYYVSLAGASFLGAILGLAVFKYILFAFIWIVTVGKVHFWLFPNLTEDVGFFESFVPVYKINFGSSASNPNTSTTKLNEDVQQIENENEENLLITENNQVEDKESTEEHGKEEVTHDEHTRTTLKELSKSTIEISTVQRTPQLGNYEKKNSKDAEEEFELVDDDGLAAAEENEESK